MGLSESYTPNVAIDFLPLHTEMQILTLILEAVADPKRFNHAGKHYTSDSCLPPLGSRRGTETDFYSVYHQLR
jgi:hypothetical protein